MALNELRVHHFRNLQHVDLHFSPKFNFLIGKNGSGKTSLLEAIFYLGHGRSFKSHLSQRIICHEADHFVLFGQIQEQQHRWQLGLQKSRTGDTVLKIDHQDGKRIADLAALIPMQVITPEGLELVVGSPEERRRFLDWGLFHQHADFYPMWSQLKRLLKQRNAALQQAQRYADLKPWDIEFVRLAEQITAWRAAYAETLCAEIEQTCRFFLPDIEIHASFYAGWNKERSFAEELETKFERDKLMGYSRSGPQRADLRLHAEGMPVSDLLSRGQLKLLVCALRLAQGEHFMREQQRQCLFLLDDFASELDDEKRARLAQRLRESESQVFITAITEAQLEKMAWLGDRADHYFHVNQGEITPFIPENTRLEAQ